MDAPAPVYRGGGPNAGFVTLHSAGMNGVLSTLRFDVQLTDAQLGFARVQNNIRAYLSTRTPMECASIATAARVRASMTAGCDATRASLEVNVPLGMFSCTADTEHDYSRVFFAAVEMDLATETCAPPSLTLWGGSEENLMLEGGPGGPRTCAYITVTASCRPASCAPLHRANLAARVAAAAASTAGDMADQPNLALRLAAAAAAVLPSSYASLLSGAAGSAAVLAVCLGLASAALSLWRSREAAAAAMPVSAAARAPSGRSSLSPMPRRKTPPSPTPQSRSTSVSPRTSVSGGVLPPRVIHRSISAGAGSSPGPDLARCLPPCASPPGTSPFATATGEAPSPPPAPVFARASSPSSCPSAAPCPSPATSLPGCGAPIVAPPPLAHPNRLPQAAQLASTRSTPPPTSRRVSDPGTFAPPQRPPPLRLPKAYAPPGPTPPLGRTASASGMGPGGPMGPGYGSPGPALGRTASASGVGLGGPMGPGYGSPGPALARTASASGMGPGGPAGYVQAWPGGPQLRPQAAAGALPEGFAGLYVPPAHSRRASTSNGLGIVFEEQTPLFGRGAGAAAASSSGGARSGGEGAGGDGAGYSGGGGGSDGEGFSFAPARSVGSVCSPGSSEGDSASTSSCASPTLFSGASTPDPFRRASCGSSDSCGGTGDTGSGSNSPPSPIRMCW